MIARGSVEAGAREEHRGQCEGAAEEPDKATGDVGRGRAGMQGRTRGREEAACGAGGRVAATAAVAACQPCSWCREGGGRGGGGPQHEVVSCCF